MVPKQSKNGKYNLSPVDFTRIRSELNLEINIGSATLFLKFLTYNFDYYQAYYYFSLFFINAFDIFFNNYLINIIFPLIIVLYLNEIMKQEVSSFIHGDTVKIFKIE